MKTSKRLLAGICTLAMAATALPSASMLHAETTYEVRDPFYNYGSGYHYFESEHFQFIWGDGGADSGKVTEEFLRMNAENLEECWDVYVNYLGMTPPTQSVEEYLRDGKEYKTNLYISGTGLSGMTDDWAYMSYDSGGYAYLFCCVGAMEYNPASWVLPHELGHVFTAHQLGWNQNKYSNTWWEAMGNWFREQWLYQVSEEKGWTNDFTHGYGTDFFETYLKNMCFTSPFGRDYYSAWILLQYLTENPDHLSGYGSNFVCTMLQNGQRDEYPFAMIDRLADANLKDTMGHFAKRMATLDFAQQTAYRKRLNDLLVQGEWNWQQIYTMLEQVDGTVQTYTVPTERAPQAFGVNVCPLALTSDTVSVTLNGLSALEGADWRGCIVIEDSAGASYYSELFGVGETASLVVPSDAVSAYLTVTATPDAALYCPSGLHWHNDSDEFGETMQPFSSKHRYPYQVTVSGAVPKKRTLANTNGHAHANGGGFVADSASVDASVYVGPNACVLGSAQVSGNAVIDGYAVIAERATVSGNAYVGDYAMVMGNATVTDNAKVLESACVYGNYQMRGNAVAKGVAFCMANGSLSGQAIADGDYYDDGGNTCTQGTVCGWYGTQTYCSSRPYTDGLFLDYSFDRDSSKTAADRYTSTYAQNCGATWEANRTGAQGVLTFDGKDDMLDLDTSFLLFDACEIQLAALWRGGSVEQKLFYFGDGENFCYLTPKNANGVAEFVIVRDGVWSSVAANVPLALGEWSVITIEMFDGTMTLTVNGAASSAAMTSVPRSVMNLSDIDTDTVSVAGCGLDGNYFNGSLDFLRVFFQDVVAPTETYAEREEIAEQPIETTTTTTDATAPVGSTLLGDVDCNGVVELADAILLARLNAEDMTVEVSTQGKVNANCDRNNTVDATDLTMVLQFLAKLITLE